ncbi:dicarboxylate/amino acid:cation symporter [Lichenifustis flavocetrariae]|uniref:Dicarboxylate/amino acid:cation symporter n=1 Tax=Lichenifustis flavocetrariae TaxID=2949735 RepID=A0AA41YWP1_9HYPH|nr:dicarboxylate/amino acid:cation symporter [Lichenifustis flavocetrariae]MCW6508368.1 dicarboxylate/amino acid:cation symporter [Lichenifustis flavocetrariae]
MVGAIGDAAAPSRVIWYRNLYIQVLIAIVIGVALGAFDPALGTAMKPFGDAFVALIRMMIAPVIFCTVVHGIATVGDLKRVGRVGIKAIVYFEVVSTVALVLGLIVAKVVQPGAGFNIDPAKINASSVANYVTAAKQDSIVAHLLGVIPSSYFDAFAKGDLLQVLLISILSGIAIAHLGQTGERIAVGIDMAGAMFFRVIGIIVRFAPIGAFGAMAYTIGAFGIKSLLSLGALVATFYGTSVLFVLVVLGAIAWYSGFSILRFIVYIKDELLIVLGTSSSETVLPRMIQKMRGLGASQSVVGLVIPTGYSFNLDGTNIYMTLSILFLAQATNTPLTLAQELQILLVAALTSKGASGVTGAGFITLAATLTVVPDIPITALAVLVGIDKFMSECRALTNLVGNGVATIVISRWEGELDKVQLAAALNGATPAALSRPDLPLGADPLTQAGVPVRDNRRV